MLIRLEHLTFLYPFVQTWIRMKEYFAWLLEPNNTTVWRADFSGGSESPASYANERQYQELHEEQGLGRCLVIAFVLVVAALFLYKCVAFLRAKCTKNTAKREDVNDFVIAAKKVLDITQEKVDKKGFSDLKKAFRVFHKNLQDSQEKTMESATIACNVIMNFLNLLQEKCELLEEKDEGLRDLNSYSKELETHLALKHMEMEQLDNKLAETLFKLVENSLEMEQMQKKVRDAENDIWKLEVENRKLRVVEEEWRAYKQSLKKGRYLESHIKPSQLFNHTLDNIPEEDEKDDPFYQDSKTAGLLGSGFACMIDIMEGIIGSRPRNGKSHQGLRQKETYGISHFQRPSKRDLNWRVVRTGSDVSSTNLTETSGQRYRRRRYETSKRRNLAGIRAPVDWTALASPRCQRQGQSDNFRSSYDREGEKRVRDDAGELSQGGRNKFQHVPNRIRSESYTAAQRSLNLR